jgi:hypothetical protein
MTFQSEQHNARMSDDFSIRIDPGVKQALRDAAEK